MLSSSLSPPHLVLVSIYLFYYMYYLIRGNIHVQGLLWLTLVLETYLLRDHIWKKRIQCCKLFHYNQTQLHPLWVFFVELWNVYLRVLNTYQYFWTFCRVLYWINTMWILRQFVCLSMLHLFWLYFCQIHLLHRLNKAKYISPFNLEVNPGYTME